MTPNLFERSRPRHFQAQPWLLSAVAHGALVCVLVLQPWSGEKHPPAQTRAEAPPSQIVWLSQPGPGGGGGGGGDRSAQPPRVAQLPGRDRLTVPAVPQTSKQVAEEIKPDTIQHLEIPAQTLASAELAISGVLETAPPGISRGSGDGPGAGSGKQRGIGPGDGDGLGAGRDRGTGGDVYRPGNGVSLPTAVYRAEPRYTSAAMRARIQGAVLVECVVDINGACTQRRLLRSLDSTFGLDEQALLAAAEWRFRPGTRLGEPVPVVVTIELGFTIH
jgi:periplasmic protein TonB